MSRTLDQIGGTSGFRYLCSIAWTTSDAAPHDIMIFEWCLHTRSPECMCSLWNYTEKTRLPFYYLLVSLPRQDCRKVWVLLECLRTLDQIGGTSGFRDLCSIATWLQVTLLHLLPWIFEWCTHTRSQESWVVTTLSQTNILRWTLLLLISSSRFLLTCWRSVKRISQKTLPFLH